MVSDHTLDMLGVCSERLEVDPQLAAVVKRYNQSELYAWFQTTSLHVWLCLGRMYTPAVDNREIMSQEMSDHFFSVIEDRLLTQGITNPLAFNREYKRLAQIFHGTCVAYDKAYERKDDELLSKAIWRNLLNQNPEEWQNSKDLKDLVLYVKKQKVVLKFCDPEAFCKGVVPFASFESSINEKK